ncbi:MAG: glycosyltransferase family 2 protein [Pseudomonadota bacterium]
MVAIPQPLVSATVITRDEQTCLAACLESLCWADEIIVLDSGSTDRTVRIASRFTDKVYVEGWRGYGAQKNRAVDLAGGQWVLSIDADEHVPQALAKEIRAAVRTDSLNGYWIPRKNMFAGRWVRRGGWYPDRQLRLFRRGSGLFGERAVHESLKLEGKAGRLRNALIHHTYESVTDYLARLNHYSSLGAVELLHRGKRAGLLDLTLRPAFAFARSYVLRGGFLEGVLGFNLAVLGACATFAKYAKLRELMARESLDRQGEHRGPAKPGII